MDLSGNSLVAPGRSVVLAGGDPLLFFGVDRDDRLAPRKAVFRPLVDVLGLGSPVRVVSSFRGLGR